MPVGKAAVTINGTALANIDDLEDVAINSPSDGEVLTYDNGDWVNQPIPPAALAGLTDVTMDGTPSDGQILIVDGSVWTNASVGLNTLSDVTLTSPSIDQILIHDGNTWINQAIPQGTLAGLTDVVLSGPPTSGQPLVFNGSTWNNADVYLNDLYDVTLTAVGVGHTISYDGNGWVNIHPNLSNMSDITLTTLVTGQVLTYNGSEWINAPASLVGIVQSPIYAPGMNLDWTNTSEIRIVMEGDLDIVGMSGAADGQRLSLKIKQSATGNHTLTISAGNVRIPTDIGTITISGTANAIHRLGLMYDATDDKYDVVAWLGGF